MGSSISARCRKRPTCSYRSTAGLIDLLDQPDRGCTYLETHGELRLAVEIAEGRAEEPALAVRLLWKAGERDRAVVVARRHGAFAAAIARCERSRDQTTGHALRREWSSRLLAGGDLVGAYDTLAPCEDPASVAIRRRTLDLGLAADGDLHTLMTARAVRARRPDAADHVAAVLARDDEQASTATGRAVARLADDLAAPSTAPFDADAVRPLLRRLIAIDGGASERVKTITDRSRDAVLRADLPKPGPAAKVRTAGLDVTVDRADRGVVEVLDARTLPDGSTVAVLRDVGIRLFRPDGRRRTDIDLPCDFVVPADHGGSLLACRRIDEGSVTAWLVHLADGRRMHVGDVRTSIHAPTFDGSTWFVAHGSTLWMLDILAEGPTALWAQADLGGTVVGLARSTKQLAIAAYRSSAGADRVAAHAFLFTLPSLTGYGMRPVAIRPGRELLDDGSVTYGAVAHDGANVALVEHGDDQVVVTCRPRRSPSADPLARLTLPSGEPRVFLDSGILVVSDHDGRIERIDIRRRERLPPIRAIV